MIKFNTGAIKAIRKQLSGPQLEAYDAMMESVLMHMSNIHTAEQALVLVKKLNNNTSGQVGANASAIQLDLDQLVRDLKQDLKDQMQYNKSVVGKEEDNNSDEEEDDLNVIEEALSEE